MTTTVDKSIEVSVPARLAYDQWTQFEEFPKFMSGVHEVRQLDATTIHWVAEIGGVRREWDATILQQDPDRKIAWTAISGATNAGAVYFTSLAPDRTDVRLVLEYEPEGMVEAIGDKLDLVERRAERDLESFKRFIEERRVPTGAWRGSVPGDVGTPDTTSSTSHGDSGKAGISGKAVVAGVAGAAVAAGAVAATRAVQGRQEDDSTEVAELEFVATDMPDDLARADGTAAISSSPSEDAIALESTNRDDPDV
jgi:hypothetical protein